MEEKNKRKQIAWIIVLLILIIGIVAITVFCMNNNSDNNKIDSNSETILTPQDSPEDVKSTTIPKNTVENVGASHKTP